MASDLKQGALRNYDNADDNEMTSDRAFLKHLKNYHKSKAKLDVQHGNFSKYINPELTKYLQGLNISHERYQDGFLNHDGLAITVERNLTLLVTPDKYEIMNGSFDQLSDDMKRKLPNIVKYIQADLKAEKSKFNPASAPMAASAAAPSVSENKIRKYVRNRLEEITGIKKPVLNEDKKSEKLKKLDKIIAEQFKLYENISKKKTK